MRIGSRRVPLMSKSGCCCSNDGQQHHPEPGEATESDMLEIGIVEGAKPRGNVPFQSVSVCHWPSIAVTLLLSGHKHPFVHLSSVWASLECKAGDRKDWKEAWSWGHSVLVHAQL